MTALTYDRVVEIAGRLSDAQMARILECEAREEDLLAAMAWLRADDAIERETHHQPGSRIAELCEILAAEEAPDEDEAPPGSAPGSPQGV